MWVRPWNYFGQALWSLWLAIFPLTQDSRAGPRYITDSQHGRALDRCLPAALWPCSRPSAIAQKPVLSLLTLPETIIPEPGHKAARLGSVLSWPCLMKHTMPTGTVITGVCIHLPLRLIRPDYHSQINEGCSSSKCFNPFALCRL